MAYIVSVICDVCNSSLLEGTPNITYNKTTMASLARKRGWMISSKQEWICPICKEQRKSKKAQH